MNPHIPTHHQDLTIINSWPILFHLLPTTPPETHTFLPFHSYMLDYFRVNPNRISFTIIKKCIEQRDENIKSKKLSAILLLQIWTGNISMNHDIFSLLKNVYPESIFLKLNGQPSSNRYPYIQTVVSQEESGFNGAMADSSSGAWLHRMNLVHCTESRVLSKTAAV